MSNIQPGIRYCIYCLEEKWFSRKSDSQFSKEHVMPENFGRFKQALTLIGQVCDECNKIFGKELDILLGRGGREGYLRFECGQKPARELYEFDAGSLPMRIDDKDEPVWHGARVGLVNEGGKVAKKHLDVVAFRTQGSSNWKRFTKEELDALKSKSDIDLATPWEVRLLAPSPEERRSLCQRLIELGINPEWEEIENKPEREVITDYLVDAERQRAITKVAMNYFVKTYETIYPSILFHDSLLPAKKFVRHGTYPGYQIVRPTTKIAIVDSGKRVAKLAGHLATLGFGPLDGRDAIFCQIAIYNDVTHLVILSDNFRGIIPANRSAHYWCLADMTCRKVTPLDAVANFPIPFVPAGKNH